MSSLPSALLDTEPFGDKPPEGFGKTSPRLIRDTRLFVSSPFNSLTCDGTFGAGNRLPLLFFVLILFGLLVANAVVCARLRLTVLSSILVLSPTSKLVTTGNGFIGAGVRGDAPLFGLPKNENGTFGKSRIGGAPECVADLLRDVS